MAAEGPSSQGPNLHALGLLDGGKGAAAEGSMIDEIGNKLAGLLAKLTGFLPNFSNPQQSGLTQFDSKSNPTEKMINQGAKAMSSKREGSIANTMLAKHIVRDDTGLFKSETESLKRFDPQIEALPIEGRFASMDMGGYAPLGDMASPITPSRGMSQDMGLA